MSPHSHVPEAASEENPFVAAEEETKGPPSMPPGWAGWIIGGLSPSMRRSVRGVVFVVAVIGISLWLDSRAKGYIESAAEAKTNPVTDHVAELARQVDALDDRQRKYESDVAEMRADMRALKDDVRYLRDRADRRGR